MLSLLYRVLAALLLLSSCCFAQPVAVLIAYDTVDGHTERLAHWIAKGASEQRDTDVRVKHVTEVTLDDLLWSEAILVGSPVHNGNVTPVVAQFLADWPFDGRPLKNKVGGAFVAAKGASAGEETVMLGILKTMLVLEMVTFGGDDWRSAFGVSYLLDVTNGDPRVHDYTEDKAIRFGRRAAAIARSTRALRAPTSDR